MPRERKPGPIKQVVVDLLDDGMYTLCGYDEHHTEVRKIGAHGVEDMVKKTMKMMARGEK